MLLKRKLLAAGNLILRIADTRVMQSALFCSVNVLIAILGPVC